MNWCNLIFQISERLLFSRKRTRIPTPFGVPVFGTTWELTNYLIMWFLLMESRHHAFEYLFYQWITITRIFYIYVCSHFSHSSDTQLNSILYSYNMSLMVFIHKENIMPYDPLPNKHLLQIFSFGGDFPHFSHFLTGSSSQPKGAWHWKAAKLTFVNWCRFLDRDLLLHFDECWKVNKGRPAYQLSSWRFWNSVALWSTAALHQTKPLPQPRGYRYEVCFIDPILNKIELYLLVVIYHIWYII